MFHTTIPVRNGKVCKLTSQKLYLTWLESQGNTMSIDLGTGNLAWGGLELQHRKHTINTNGQLAQMCLVCNFIQLN